MTSRSGRFLRWATALFVITVVPFTLTVPGAAKSGSSGSGKGNSHKSKKLDGFLAQSDSSGSQTVPIIIQVRQGDQVRVMKSLRSLGIRVKRSHTLVSAFDADVRTEDLEKVSSLPGVTGVSYDAPIRALQWNRRPRSPPAWFYARRWDSRTRRCGEPASELR